MPLKGRAFRFKLRRNAEAFHYNRSRKHSRQSVALTSGAMMEFRHEMTNIVSKPLPKKVILKKLRQYLLKEFEAKGIDVKKASDLCGKDRQAIERLFDEVREYNGGIYFLYEVFWCTGIDLPRMEDLDKREKN